LIIIPDLLQKHIDNYHLHNLQSHTLSKPALLKKGLLRGESLSGHPEGAKAPEGSPTILIGRRSDRSEGRRPERSEGCLANARQDRWGVGASLRSAGQMGLLDRTKEGLLGRTDGKVIASLRVASA
jgi:hypothetical protein